MKKIKKNLKWITVSVVMIIIVGAFLVKLSICGDEVEPIVVDELSLEIEDVVEEKEEVLVPTNVYVDIKGAVKNPGVYEIGDDKKVIDVVQLAGGFTEQADTSMVNLAKMVSNEMVIIIYTIEEVKKAQEEGTVVKIVDKQCVCPEISNDACLNQENNQTEVSSEENDDKININIASIDDLMKLSGIGESKAEAIVEYREENGNFEKIEDIMEVPGIGEALYEKIKTNITI